MKLTQYAQVCNMAVQLGVGLNTTPKSDVHETMEKIASLYKFAEPLEKKDKLKNYLLFNPEEIEEFEWVMNDKYLVYQLDKMFTKDFQLPCKLNDFSKQAIEGLKKYRGDDEHKLFLAVYLYSIIEEFGLSFPNDINFYDTLYYVSGDGKTLYEKLLNMEKEDIIPFFYVKNFCIDAESIDTTLNNLRDFSYAGLVNYITRFIELADSELENVDCEKVLRLLNRIYFKKVKPHNIDDNKFAKLLELVQETSFETSYLNGFLRHSTVDFFEGQMDIVSYMNVAVGGKYTKLIENIPRYNNIQNLLIYALKEKKHAFLRLLEDNLDYIMANSYSINNSMLVLETFRDCVNLNEINQKSLEVLLDMSSEIFNVKNSNGEIIKLTPMEFIELANSSNNLRKLYGLLEGKVDSKLIILRQLKDVVFDKYIEREDKFGIIAKKLSTKNVVGQKKDFPFEIDNNTLLCILALDEEFDGIIKECKSIEELQFVFRNRNTIDLTIGLNKNLDNFIENDIDCKKMFELMNLSNDFMDANKEKIRKFCMLGNASIVVAYHKNNQSTQQKNILLIAKAEMAGQMDVYKFHDLNKEIEYPLNKKVETLWKNNVSKENGQFTAYETYSFADTMLIGVKPDTTCMNYAQGMYRECLLANFDSNKKILFAKKNGKIVARAIIRLTKSVKSDENTSKGVEFLDIENMEDTESKNERLTIFLERFYEKGLKPEETLKIKKMFVDMIKTKAKDMGARFLSCCYYSNCDLKEETFKVFISHTKNGVQYMDSFRGKQTVDSEASYMPINCWR